MTLQNCTLNVMTVASDLQVQVALTLALLIGCGQNQIEQGLHDTILKNSSPK